MRVLGLHGMGTSGSIFASQTESFRARLPQTFTFDFLDAPFPSAPAPGIEVFYPDTNYFSFYPAPTTAAVQGAIHWLDEHLQAHGPYDALMGFSQGCGLISSYVLYHQKRQRERRLRPTEPDDGAGDEALPFKCAMFVCGGVVLDVLEDCGVKVTGRARDVNNETSRLLRARAGKLTDIANDPLGWPAGTGLWDHTADLVHDAAGAARPDIDPADVFGLDLTDRAVGDMRITIPTAHVFSKKDPRYPASLQLAYLCDETRRTMFDHGGGHDIPRNSHVTQALTRFMESLAKESSSL